MGLAGAHVIIVLLVPAVILAAVAAGVYFLVKKAVAAGVREGQRGSDDLKRGPRGR